MVVSGRRASLQAPRRMVQVWRVLLPLVVAASLAASQNTAAVGAGDDVGLALTPTSPTVIDASWNEVENATHYQVTWDPEAEGEVGSSNTTTETTYSITGLTPCTTYTVTVQPQEDTGPVGEPGTAEGTTLTPDFAVTLTSPNSTKIEASWTSVPTASGYEVTWGVEGEPGDGSNTTTTTGTTFIITGLAPCTTYTVTVQPRKGDQLICGLRETEDHFTLTQAVTPVASLTVEPVPGQSSQLAVAWELEEDMGNCSVTCRITWTLEDGTPVGEEELEQVTVTEYTVEGLEPFTSYTVCVASKLTADFPFPKCEDDQTVEDAPGPPSNVHVEPEGPEELRVCWEEPVPPNGVITNYTVTWAPPDGSGTLVVDGDGQTNATITGLLPCSTYSVTVTAATSVGCGPESNQTSGTTEPAEPDPPTNINAALISDQSDSLNITWTPTAAPGNCSVTSYTVCWSLAATGAFVDCMTVPPTEGTTITGLQPFTTYTVNLTTAVDTVLGPAGDSVNGTTDEDVPGSAPTNPAAKTLNSSSLEATWGSPNKPNGIITEYKVEWRAQGRVEEAQEATVSGDTTRYVIGNLSECTAYTVTLTAATVKGYSDHHSDATGHTAPEAPPSPQSVSCKTLQSRELAVSWVSPVTSCPELRYTLSYTGDVLWSNTSDNGTESSNTLIITLKDLTPWTKYTVCVFAVVEGDLPGPQDCCSNTTQQAEPGSPASLTQTEAKTSSVTVSWEPPLALNGKLTEYLLTWGGENTTLSPDTLSYTRSSLKPGSRHYVTLQARTEEGGWGDLIAVTAETTPVNVGAIVGGVVGGLLLLLAVVVMYVFRDKLKLTKNSLRSASSKHPLSGAGDSTAQQNQSSGGAKDMELTAMRADGEIRRSQLRQYISRLEEDTQRLLEEEFGQLKEQSAQHSTHAATRDFNKVKNRFINILPFDQTRVKLPIMEGQPGSDYINANYIKDSRGRNYFLASQGPKPNTVEDFWRTVWELKVYTIVMLTNLKEKGREKCTMYWPRADDPPLTMGGFTITTHSEENDSTCRVRSFAVEREGVRRTVKQYHFVNWPDFGAPRYEHHLLDFVRKVRSTMPTSGDHLVVHCSAGVGRTGTFIGLWTLMDTLDASTLSPTINVKQAVLAMRECRPSMVQAQEQYLYLYKCVAAYLEEPHRWRTEERDHEHVYDNVAFSEEPVYANIPSSNSSSLAGRGFRGSRY